MSSPMAKRPRVARDPPTTAMTRPEPRTIAGHKNLRVPSIRAMVGNSTKSDARPRKFEWPRLPPGRGSPAYARDLDEKKRGADHLPDVEGCRHPLIRCEGRDKDREEVDEERQSD